MFWRLKKVCFSFCLKFEFLEYRYETFVVHQVLNTLILTSPKITIPVGKLKKNSKVLPKVSEISHFRGNSGCLVLVDLRY